MNEFPLPLSSNSYYCISDWESVVNLVDEEQFRSTGKRQRATDSDNSQLLGSDIPDSSIYGEFWADFYER